MATSEGTTSVKAETKADEKQEVKPETKEESKPATKPLGSIDDEFPMTSAGQIERLTRPGSKYFNMSPFEVLQLPMENTSMVDVRKKYRKLAVLIHPDKNPENHDKATTAFDAVNKAYIKLQSAIDFELSKSLVAAARKQVEIDLQKQKESLKRKGKDFKHLEEGTDTYERALRVKTCKIFADKERERIEAEEREAEQKKKEKEMEMQMEVELKRMNAEKQSWESGREERVDGWRSFKGRQKRQKVRYRKR